MNNDYTNTHTIVICKKLSSKFKYDPNLLSGDSQVSGTGMAA